MLALDKPRTAPPGWWTQPPPFPAGHSLAAKPRSKAAALSKKSVTDARWAGPAPCPAPGEEAEALCGGLLVVGVYLPSPLWLGTVPQPMRQGPALWLLQPGLSSSQPRPCCAGMAWRHPPLRSPGWPWPPSQLPGLQCSRCHWCCRVLSLLSLVSLRRGHLPPLPQKYRRCAFLIPVLPATGGR